MRDYFVVWRGQQIVIEPNVTRTAWAEEDPGPQTLFGFDNPWTKRYLRMPDKKKFVEFLNRVDVFHHPADPIVVSYDSVLIGLCGGEYDDWRDIPTPDGGLGYSTDRPRDPRTGRFI